MKEEKNEKEKMMSIKKKETKKNRYEKIKNMSL
jgi:hypothetical protein